MFMIDDTTAPFGKGKSKQWEEKVTRRMNGLPTIGA